MISKESVMFVEFNELSPVLVEQFVRERQLPNFRRFYEESHVYTSDAGEKAPYLNPWIQWVTVHTGLTYAQHQVFHLGEAHKLKVKRTWDLVSEAGMPVWICGSMNSSYVSNPNGYFLPDPWATETVPQPESLDPYFRFVRMNVLEHSNDRVPLSWKDYAKFLGFMTTHGLSTSTVGAGIRQLLSEKDGRNRWKRAVILDKLQFDMFRSVYRKIKPRFSTFFSNSTAHFQHYYWRHMNPEAFAIRPTAQELEEYKTAILVGYQAMDRLLGRFIELAGDDATLILCTALSQQPCLIYEEQGGKVVYRPRDFEAVLNFAGVTHPHSVAPVMAEEFHLRFENGADAAEAADRLRGLFVGEHPALRVEARDGGVFVGCAFRTQLPEETTLCLKGSDRTVPFFDIFYRLYDTLKSGMHHPDGMLWIRRRNRSHHVYPTKVSLTSIAPTVLDLLSVPRSEYMRDLPLPLAA
jgi:hypothetical protein